MSTVTRMIQSTTVISSLTYSNSFLPGLPAPTLACFLSIFNIVSNQTDPIRKTVLLLCSIPYCLPPSVPFTFHCKQEPSSLQWPTRPYIIWDLVHLSDLISNSCLLCSLHTNHTGLSILPQICSALPGPVPTGPSAWTILPLCISKANPLVFFISLVKCHPTNEDHPAHPLVLNWILPSFPGMSPLLYPVLISLPLLLPPPATELTTV